MCIKTNRFPYINEAFDVDPEVYEKAFEEWLSCRTCQTKEELDFTLKKWLKDVQHE
jgi:hypothetical protein